MTLTLTSEETLALARLLDAVEAHLSAYSSVFEMNESDEKLSKALDGFDRQFVNRVYRMSR